jgi:hypothetical protein
VIGVTVSYDISATMEEIWTDDSADPKDYDASIAYLEAELTAASTAGSDGEPSDLDAALRYAALEEGSATATAAFAATVSEPPTEYIVEAVGTSMPTGQPSTVPSGQPTSRPTHEDCSPGEYSTIGAHEGKCQDCKWPTWSVREDHYHETCPNFFMNSPVLANVIVGAALLLFFAPGPMLGGIHKSAILGVIGLPALEVTSTIAYLMNSVFTREWMFFIAAYTVLVPNLLFIYQLMAVTRSRPRFFFLFPASHYVTGAWWLSGDNTSLRPVVRVGEDWEACFPDCGGLATPLLLLEWPLLLALQLVSLALYIAYVAFNVFVLWPLWLVVGFMLFQVPYHYPDQT